MNCFTQCRSARLRERELRGEIARVDDLARRLSPGIASPDGVRTVGREDIAELVARKADLPRERAQCVRVIAREGEHIEKALEDEANERRKRFCMYYYQYGRSMGEAARIADVRERTAYRWRAKLEQK